MNKNVGNKNSEKNDKRNRRYKVDKKNANENKLVADEYDLRLIRWYSKDIQIKPKR